MHKREEGKFLSINGIEPTQAHIRSGTYPFTAILYAVTREDEPDGSPAKRLIDWILSDEGRSAIADGGFVPVSEQ